MPAQERVAQLQFRESLRLNQTISNRELAQVLREAAADAEQLASRIGNMSGIGARTRTAQLRIAADGAREISRGLWTRADKQIRTGIFDAVDLAVNQMMDLDALLGMPVEGILGYAQGMQASAGRTAEAIISRRRWGYNLSERVVRNQARATGRIHRVIESGLANRLSARELARQVGSLIRPDTPGGVSYAAMRLARTEINNAYHWAARDHRETRPWIDAVAWELSGSHPEADACDDLKALGPYKPKDVPDKPHPHCLCFTIPITPTPDQFVNNLLGGDYNEWIEDQGLEPLGVVTAPRDSIQVRYALRRRETGISWWDIQRETSR